MTTSTLHTGPSNGRMPVLFIGHGNPMHAIQDTPFTRMLAALGPQLPRPKAILCISAHWMTKGTWVTRMEKPKTIHDFYGFPKPLFEVQYPAPGSVELADWICRTVTDPSIQADDIKWGLDHGTWSVLRHLYPQADIPVVQLSLDLSQPPEYHFRIGQQLQGLRQQGVLILGSGNIVHNLGRIDFSPEAKPFDWAIEFDTWVKDRLLQGDYASLVRDALASQAGQLSIPTPDHWYPLLYVLGAADVQDNLRFEFEGIELGSISMRCLSLGR